MTKTLLIQSKECQSSAVTKAWALQSDTGLNANSATQINYVFLKNKGTTYTL